MKNLKSDNISAIYKASPDKKIQIPAFDSNVSAGFPNPADDYKNSPLDLNEKFIKHSSSSFFVKVKGDSMTNAGILPGDFLLVDRSLDAVSGKIIIAVIEGEFTVKRLLKKGRKIFLVPENENYKTLEITEYMDFQIWGVVKSVHREL